MKTKTSEYGSSAGKIWKALNTKGPQSKTSLKKTTKLSDEKLFAAIGWLARENKLSKMDNAFLLSSETNLEYDIGQNAGKIWDALSTWGECDISSLKTLTQITDSEVYSAIGWLAREDKILECRKKNQKQIKFCLK